MLLSGLLILASSDNIYELYDKVSQTDNLSFLYQYTWFDYFVLFTYFGSLILLAVYGLRRLYYVRLYNRFRDVRPEPDGFFDPLPMVTVQLPMYNEMYVGTRILESVCKFDYPKDKLHIQVLDDSTDETREIMKRAVAFWQKRGFQVEYIHRVDRTGFKAGALENGMRTARGEIIAIFDADFVPNSDFLQKTIHYFKNPEVGIVQTRWAHLNTDYSLLTRCQSIFLDGHFMMESLPRNRGGYFVNFNGTAGLWRRAAVIEAGGWEHDTITEDLDLSLRAQMKGWKMVFLPHIECPAELPVEMNAFKNQQNRWAKGSTQVCIKLLWRIMKADIPRPIKTEVFFHLTANFAYPLMVILAAILIPANIVRYHMGLAEMILLDLPIFLATTGSMFVFYKESQKALYPDWKKRLRLLPFLMAVGIGLSVTNGKAVMEAVFRIPSAFIRTPKFRVIRRSDGWTKKRYRGKLGLSPLLEIAVGFFFIWGMVYNTMVLNFGVLPFLLLFVVGYLYTGCCSLAHNLSRWPLLDMPLRKLRVRTSD
jgi:cellulose synthase/poly-beta-1,6-N-acetylglucosamine synthase-like glycosyltransferase